MDAYDIVVVGGGLVGLALAKALSHSFYRILLVEKNPFKLPEHVSPDARSIALSLESKHLLESMSAWDTVAPFAGRIDHVHVSDQGRFGFCRLNAQDEGLEALGYVVPLPAIAKGLEPEQGLVQNDKIHVADQTQLVSFENGEQGVSATLQKQDGAPFTVQAKLMIAADGLNSGVREKLNIKSVKKDYQQSAVVCQAELSQSHEHRAFERFTEEGPLAILPLVSGKVGVVWVVNSDRAQALANLPSDEFCRQLQRAFGYRAGRFISVDQPTQYPLTLLSAQEQRVGRVLLMGNAVHHLHPVAGQGFNLSLRDVKVLADLCLQQTEGQVDWETILLRYLALRQKDQQWVTRVTDGLIDIFTSQTLGLRSGRGLALSALERAPWLKTKLNNVMMGLCYPKVV